jgi:hypothetical protein
MSDSYNTKINHALILRLENLDLTKVENFSFSGLATHAKVIKIYDSNTVELAFNVFGKFVRYNCRINNIPHLSTRSNNFNEKVKAVEIKNKLENLIFNKVVDVIFNNFDQFGRISIDIYQNNKNIATLI